MPNPIPVAVLALAGSRLAGSIGRALAWTPRRVAHAAEATGIRGMLFTQYRGGEELIWRLA